MQAGDMLADRYELEASLGRGTQGEVWRANDLRLGRAVAVKVLRESDITQESLKRFQREAMVGARLQHPGITVVHDFGQHKSRHFMVMELLDGTDLATHLKQRLRALSPSKVQGLPVPEALGLVLQAAEALAAAHEQQVVHRDIKPANLFLLRRDRLKICDFGLAHTSQAAGQLTLTGAQFGTPAFMSPEQWLNSKDVGTPTDVYALGCVLYALLTGNPPFLPAKDSWPALMLAHLGETPPPVRSVRDDITDDVDQLVETMLAKEPSTRPAIDAVARALRQLGREPWHPPTVVDIPDAVAQLAAARRGQYRQLATALRRLAHLRALDQRRAEEEGRQRVLSENLSSEPMTVPADNRGRPVRFVVATGRRGGHAIAPVLRPDSAPKAPDSVTPRRDPGEACALVVVGFLACGAGIASAIVARFPAAIRADPHVSYGPLAGIATFVWFMTGLGLGWVLVGAGKSEKTAGWWGFLAGGTISLVTIVNITSWAHVSGLW